MTETPLRSITNSGTWMLILAPTYSTKIFIGRTVLTTYVIPLVIGMLLARDSIVGIPIPCSILLTARLFTHSATHDPVTNTYHHGSVFFVVLADNEIELGMMKPTIESQASNIPMTKGTTYVVMRFDR